MTKLEQAVEILKANEFATNAEFVFCLMTKLGMSKLGARTYAYNARKVLGKTLKASKAPSVSAEPGPEWEVYKLPPASLKRVFGNIKASTLI